MHMGPSESSILRKLLKKSQAENAKLTTALVRIASNWKCTSLMLGYKDCEENWSDAMGKKLPREYQESRWCHVCVARAALKTNE